MKVLTSNRWPVARKKGTPWHASCHINYSLGNYKGSSTPKKRDDIRVRSKMWRCGDLRRKILHRTTSSSLNYDEGPILPTLNLNVVGGNLQWQITKNQ